MTTVTDACWEYTNEMAMKAVSFGVALKYIRLAIENPDLTAEQKIKDIEISLRLHKKEIDSFLKAGENSDQ